MEPSAEFAPPISICKAIIAPFVYLFYSSCRLSDGFFRHAGYSYSGPAAAWAYKSIDTTNMCVHILRRLDTSPSDKCLRKRVFILGPSHHVYLDGCALSLCDEYETPVGVLPIDLDSGSIRDK